MKFIIFAYFTKFFENLKNKTTLVGYNDFFLERYITCCQIFCKYFTDPTWLVAIFENFDYRNFIF